MDGAQLNPKNDQALAMDSLRQARRELSEIQRAYESLQESSQAFANLLDRGREIAFWMFNPDADVSFWDTCDTAGKGVEYTRKWLLKTLDRDLAKMLLYRSQTCPLCHTRSQS